LQCQVSHAADRNTEDYYIRPLRDSRRAGARKIGQTLLLYGRKGFLSPGPDTQFTDAEAAGVKQEGASQKPGTKDSETNVRQ
jgi:hypothetical protein